jgi:hypothetical protein
MELYSELAPCFWPCESRSQRLGFGVTRIVGSVDKSRDTRLFLIAGNARGMHMYSFLFVRVSVQVGMKISVSRQV